MFDSALFEFAMTCCQQSLFLFPDPECVSSWTGRIQRVCEYNIRFVLIEWYA